MRKYPRFVDCKLKWFEKLALFEICQPIPGSVTRPYSPPSNSSAEKITPHSIVEANPTRTPHPMPLSHPRSLPEHNQSPPATGREPHVPRADAVGARGPPGRHARGAEPAAVPQPHWQLYRLDRLWPRRQGAPSLCGTLSTRSRSRRDRRMRCLLLALEVSLAPRRHPCGSGAGAQGNLAQSLGR